MRRILPCLVLFLAVPVALAQRPNPNPNPEFEYGSINDLRGVTRIYVYCGQSIGIRNSIVKTIQKHLPQITLADSPTDAQVTLSIAGDSYTYLAGVYRSSTSQTTGTTSETGRVDATTQPIGNTTATSGTYSGTGTYSGQTTTYGSSTPMYRRVDYAQGLVTMRGHDGRIRLVMDYHGTNRFWWQKGLETKFANAFIDAYKKANKEPKG
jgi:hypothetical protein